MCTYVCVQMWERAVYIGVKQILMGQEPSVGHSSPVIYNESLKGALFQFPFMYKEKQDFCD